MFVSTVITSPYNYEWCCGDDGYCSMWGRTSGRFADWQGKKKKYGWPLCLPWNRANLCVLKTQRYLQDIEKARPEWQEHVLAFSMGSHPRLGKDSLIRKLDPALVTKIMKLAYPIPEEW